jgi:hypothetical protein
MERIVVLQSDAVTGRLKTTREVWLRKSLKMRATLETLSTKTQGRQDLPQQRWGELGGADDLFCKLTEPYSPEFLLSRAISRQVSNST